MADNEDPLWSPLEQGQAEPCESTTVDHLSIPTSVRSLDSLAVFHHIPQHGHGKPSTGRLRGDGPHYSARRSLEPAAIHLARERWLTAESLLNRRQDHEYRHYDTA
jgi:hypothetical protein